METELVGRNTFQATSQRIVKPVRSSLKDRVDAQTASSHTTPVRSYVVSGRKATVSREILVRFVTRSNRFRSRIAVLAALGMAQATEKEDLAMDRTNILFGEAEILGKHVANVLVGFVFFSSIPQSSFKETQDTLRIGLCFPVQRMTKEVFHRR